MKTPDKKPGEKKQPYKGPAEENGLRTDYPLSEKDEIKQAEEKMRKTAKKKP